MAKVSAHGQEIGTIYTTTSAKRHMNDGTVLLNAGFGWKLHAKVKANIRLAFFIIKGRHFAAHIADIPGARIMEATRDLVARLMPEVAHA